MIFGMYWVKYNLLLHFLKLKNELFGTFIYVAALTPGCP